MASVQELLTKGNEQYNSKQYQQAINIMNQVLKLKLNFSDVADASYLRARCYALLGNESSALNDLQTALEFNESLVNSAEEDSDFNELKSKDKFKSLSKLFKGILKYYDGDYETGLNDMEEAIKQDSSFSTYFVATNSRANALWGLERYDKAIELFREAEFHAADSFDKYTGFKNLACILSELERYQESMFPFRFAIQSYQVAEKEGKFILDRTQLSPVYEEQGWALIGIDD